MTIHILTFDTDPDRYQIELPAPLDELTDGKALGLMRDSLSTLAHWIARDAAKIITDDYGDDDTDYMPARANAYAALTEALLSDFTPADALRHLLKNHEVVTDFLTLSADTRLALSIDYIY